MPSEHNVFGHRHFNTVMNFIKLRNKLKLTELGYKWTLFPFLKFIQKYKIQNRIKIQKWNKLIRKEKNLKNGGKEMISLSANTAV